MNANSAINIGATHSLCEDYVIAQSEGHYVILSDCCSSSPDTDIGARLLVKAAENILTKQAVDGVEQLHKEAARLVLEAPTGPDDTPGQE